LVGSRTIAQTDIFPGEVGFGQFFRSSQSQRNDADVVEIEDDTVPQIVESNSVEIIDAIDLRDEEPLDSIQVQSKGIRKHRRVNR
jgi:hypothetical protein